MSEWLNEQQVKAITDAFRREVAPEVSNTWEEVKDLTLADLCRANQDALIDNLYEDHPDDRQHRDGMIGSIKIYDALLGTSRAGEIPEEGGTS